MAKNDFSGMTLKQMIDMHKNLGDAIENKRKEEREDTRQALEDLAVKRGLASRTFLARRAKKAARLL